MPLIMINILAVPLWIWQKMSTPLSLSTLNIYHIMEQRIWHMNCSYLNRRIQYVNFTNWYSAQIACNIRGSSPGYKQIKKKKWSVRRYEIKYMVWWYDGDVSYYYVHQCQWQHFIVTSMPYLFFLTWLVPSQLKEETENSKLIRRCDSSYAES